MNLPRIAFKPPFYLAFAVIIGLTLLTVDVVPAAGATLTVSPTPIWAGNVVVGRSVTLSSTLKNSGPQSVTVSKAVSNNSAYTVTSPAFPLTLAAGRSVSVTVQFAPKAAQRMIGIISFSSNAANPTLSLALNGWGVSSMISASPASVNFGSVKVGSQGTVYETLTNTGSASLTISSANTNGSAFGRTGITPPVTLAPAHSITFTLFFLPKTAGAASGSLTVLTNAKNNTLTIPLSGNSAAGGTLSVSPASANLGSVAVGSSKTMSATLLASTSSVVVSSATTTNSEFTVSGLSLPLTVAAGKSVPITVKFSPTASGTATAKLSFASNATNSPAIESLTGTGTVATQHRVSLSWKASSSTVAGYNVYRATASGGPYSKITASSNASTSYSDSSVQASKTYYYVVTAVTSQGAESAYSNQVVAVVP